MIQRYYLTATLFLAVISQSDDIAVNMPQSSQFADCSLFEHLIFYVS